MQTKKHTIHDHFKHLCEKAYEHSAYADILDVKNTSSKVLHFLKHYLNAMQLRLDDMNMCGDLLNGKKTAATFLMRAQYSSLYIHTMMRSRINASMRLALEGLKSISDLERKKFRLFLATFLADAE